MHPEHFGYIAYILVPCPRQSNSGQPGLQEMQIDLRKKNKTECNLLNLYVPAITQKGISGTMVERKLFT